MLLAFLIAIFSGFLLRHVVCWLSIKGDALDSMSIITRILAQGSFPKETKCPEPNISILLRFRTDELPTKSSIIEAIERVVYTSAYKKLLCIPRFKNGNGFWEAFKDIDLNLLVNEVELDNEYKCIKYVEMVSFDDIGHDLPLWRFTVIKNKDSNKDSYVLFKIHHAIGDGLSLLGLFLSFVTDMKGEKLPIPSLTRKSLKEVQLKTSVLEHIIGFASNGVVFIRSLFKILRLPLIHDSDTAIHKNRRPFVYQGNSQLVVSNGISLSTLKVIKSAVGNGCTINDVIVSLLTGAFRRYLEECDDSILNHKDKRVRALFPVAFPRNIDPEKVISTESLLENYWILCSLDLPIDIPSSCPLQRLLECSSRCKEIKHSYEPILQYGLQQLAASVLPTSVAFQTNCDVITGHHCVFTNVPGPTQPVKMCGSEVKGLYALVPNATNQISFVSYNGVVSITWVLENSVGSFNRLDTYLNDELSSIVKCLKL